MFFLGIDKPVGYTSHDVIALMRVLTGIKRIGHTGTLDPFASGVLVLAFEDATKLISYIPSYSKKYDCTLQLGEERETADCTGRVVRKMPVPLLERHQIEGLLHSFEGEQIQTPPLYSAIKVNGRRLYEYARAGESVEIPSRTVHIHCIQNLNIPNSEEIAFEVECSKGTYIRSLGCDIAQKMGTVGHLNRLCRLSSDGIDLDQCVSFADLATWAAGENAGNNWELALSKEGRAVYPRKSRSEFLGLMRPHTLSVTHCFTKMPKYEVDKEQAFAVAQGKSPKIQITENHRMIQVIYADQLLAIAIQHSGLLKLQRVNPSIAQNLLQSNK